MKVLLLTFFIFSKLFAVELSDCLQDALTQASSTLRAVAPLEECTGILKNHPQTLHFTSKSKKLHLFGQKHLFYFEGPEGTLLMSGDQTGLREIKSFYLDEDLKKIYVLQDELEDSRYGVLTFPLDLVGNVAPTSHLRTLKFQGATGVRPLKSGQELAIFSESKNLVIFINASADNTRYRGGRFTPKLLRTYEGEKAKTWIESFVR